MLNDQTKMITTAIITLLLFASSGTTMAQPTVFCAPPSPTPKSDKNEDNSPKCSIECQTCNASPCFAKTGVYRTSTTDLQIPTIGLPLVLMRSYESWHGVDGPTGYGWMSNLAARLYYATYLQSAPDVYTNEAVVVMPDGEAYRYKENADGTFRPPAGRRDTLVRSADGTYQLTVGRGGVRFGFAADGALLSMKDEYGNTLRFSHDSARRVIRVDDDSGTGRHLIVTWNPSGRISSVTDNAGRVVSYSYNADGTLSSVSNPEGQTTTYTYEQRRFGPLLARVTDHWGRVLTDVTWDARDRVSTYTEAGETYTMTYVTDLLQPRTVKTHSVGAQTITYDHSGLVTSRGAGSTVYNADGDVEVVTDARGRRTRYTYLSGGRVATATYNEGSTEGVGDVSFHYQYDATYPDKVAGIEPHIANWGGTVFNGHWRGWKYTYYTATDAGAGQLAGALKQVERMAYQDQSLNVLTKDCGQTCLFVSYKYDMKGRVTQTWNRTEGGTTYAYDDAQNQLTVTRASNGTGSAATIHEFDSLGRTASVTDPLGNVTSYTYDDLDRILTVTLPKPSAASTLDFVTTYSYDHAGANTALTYTHITDPNGRVTKHGYDQFGRLVESIDAAGNTTAYSYTNGLLSSITDANGNVTSYAYDGMRFLKKTTFPDGAAETYTHYGDGLLASKTDRKGVKTTYEYDAFGRLVAQVTGSSSRRFGYTGEKLTLTTDTYNGITEHNELTYDPKTFLVTSEVQGRQMDSNFVTVTRGTVNYTWDTESDRLLKYSVKDGGSNRTPPVTTYSYHPDGSVDWMRWDHVTGLFDFTYDLNGQLTEISFPNGQKRQYTYDGQGRVTKLWNRYNNSNLALFLYEYDRDETTGQFTMLGQRTKVTAAVPAWPTPDVTTTYFYDSLYQLVRTKTVTTTTRESAWTYDAIGNRLTATAPSVATNYTYVQNASGKNTARLSAINGTSITHDLNGNMTAYGGSTFGWDPLDRMSQLLGFYNFKYDYQNRRTAIDYQSTKYIYNGVDPVAISYKQDNGYYLADYLFAPGIDQPLARGDYQGVTYYSVDALGSVILLTDKDGVVKNHYAYTPWGELERESGPVVQPFAYTGREFTIFNSNQRNYYHYRARDMMPSLGRFLSEDSARFDVDINLYRYVHNTPVGHTDATGEAPYPLWGPPPEKYKKCQSAKPLSPNGPGACQYGSAQVNLGYQKWDLDCVCKNMGDNPGANCVRGCIQCMKSIGMDVTDLGPHWWCRKKCEAQGKWSYKDQKQLDEVINQKCSKCWFQVK